MMVELQLGDMPDLELDGYETVETERGTIYYSAAEQRPAVVVKEHPDGNVSVTTDNVDVISQAAQAGDVVDLHAT